MKEDIVSIFKKRALETLTSPNIRFILFGSRGRGDADEFSDYDILIITSKDEADQRERIEEIETDIFVTYSAIINSHLFSEAEIRRLSFEPFIVNALAEGIAA